MMKFQSPFKAGHILVEQSFLTACIEAVTATRLQKKQAFGRSLIADILFKNTDVRYNLACEKRIYRDSRNRDISHSEVNHIMYTRYEYLRKWNKLKQIHVPKTACRILYRDGSESAIITFLWLLLQQRKHLWFTFQSHLQRFERKFGVSSRKSLNGVKELRDLRIIEKIREDEAVSKIQEHGFTYRWGKAIGVNLGVAKTFVPDALITY